MLEEKSTVGPSENAENTSKSTDVILTKEEVDLYDRQIRLWGVESQKRLRHARILVAGLNGLGNEVCKNIILAGVDHMTILDHRELSKDDWEVQFLAKRSDIGQNRAAASYQRLHELNPMVNLVVDTDDISEKTESFFKRFHVVCLLGFSKNIQLQVNEICHSLGVKFLSGGSYGYYGYMFSDLCMHTYAEEKIKVDKITGRRSVEPAHKRQKLDSNVLEDVKEMVEKVGMFRKLSSALSYDSLQGFTLKQLKSMSKAYFVMQVLFEFVENNGRYPDMEHKTKDWQQLLETRNSVFEKLQIDNDLLPDDFVSNCIGEITPVSCIIGGIIAQDIIKAVSGKDKPHNNFFFYDGLETSGLVDCIGRDS
eukprot:gene17643-19398_t